MKPLSERLTADEVEAVDLFRQRLLSEFSRDVTDVRLFGSKARGEAGPDSDGLPLTAPSVDSTPIR